MASSINVSYEDLNNAAGKLNTDKETIRGDLDKVRTFINGLVSSGFVTQHASGKFDTATQQFVTGAKDVMKGLEDLATYLTQTATALEKVDQELASKITLN